MWIARDKVGYLFIFLKQPPERIDTPDGDGYWAGVAYNHHPLPSELFPEVKWEDEAPRKVKLVLEPAEIELEAE